MRHTDLEFIGPRVISFGSTTSSGHKIQEVRIQILEL